MATLHSQSQGQRNAPAEAGYPNVVERHDSEQAAHPFPVADIVGIPIRPRPYLAPHRLAGVMADREMAEALREELHLRRIHRRGRITEWICNALLLIAIVYFGLQLIRGWVS